MAGALCEWLACIMSRVSFLAGDTDTFVAMVRSQITPVMPANQWKRRVPRAETVRHAAAGSTIANMHFDTDTDSDDDSPVHAASDSTYKPPESSGSDSDESDDSVDNSDNYT